MTTNLQELIRLLVKHAESEENAIVNKSLMTAAWILEVADETLNYQPTEKSLETCLGFQLSDIADNKDTQELVKLEFKPYKIADCGNKKVLYIDKDGTRILFSRNKYVEQYPNNGPIVGKVIDEINLVNESDYIVVARYPVGGGTDADYVDSAAFDIREVKLTISNNNVEFLSTSPPNVTIKNFDKGYAKLEFRKDI